MLNRRQLAILAIGGSITLGIGAFYIIKDKTSFWLPKPITCRTFPTKDVRFDKEVEVCVNEVKHPYVYANGDVELGMTFMRGRHERIQVAATVWVADNINGRPTNYAGEMNFSRVRLYDDGILVFDFRQKFSTWTNPVVPADVRIPLWKWIHDQAETFDRPRLSLDEKFHQMIGSLINTVSVATSACITVWKVLTAQG